jgi:hypothetical protein
MQNYASVVQGVTLTRAKLPILDLFKKPIVIAS